jgi:hypothetical protein
VRCSPRLAGAAVTAAAPPTGAALLLMGKGKAIFFSAMAAQGFTPAQGLPLVSFHPSFSSSVYATYTSAAAVALQPPFLVPFCAAVEGIAATGNVAWVIFTQLAMAPPPPRVLDFSQHSSVTQQSLSSVFQLSTPNKLPPPYAPPKINDCAAKRARHDDNDGDNDPPVFNPSKYNADDDYIDVTSAKEGSGVPGQSSHSFDAEREMIESNKAVFMERAFATQDGDDGGDVEGFHLCRPQKELDLIAYIVMNWQIGINLKKMEPGPEKDWVTKFQVQI